MNSFHKMVPRFIHTETTCDLIIQKNLFYILTFVTLCVFRTLFKMTFQNPINTPINKSYPFNSDDTLSDDASSQEDLFPRNIIHHQILPFKTTLLLVTQDVIELQKPINLTLHIEKINILKMTYNFLLISVFDKLKPIII